MDDAVRVIIERLAELVLVIGFIAASELAAR